MITRAFHTVSRFKRAARVLNARVFPTWRIRTSLCTAFEHLALLRVLLVLSRTEPCRALHVASCPASHELTNTPEAYVKVAITGPDEVITDPGSRAEGESREEVRLDSSSHAPHRSGCFCQRA